MMRAVPSIISIVAILSIIGCGGDWRTRTDHTVVWSDDGAKIAYGRNRYDERPRSTFPVESGFQYRNERYALFARDSGGVEVITVLSERPGSIRSLYYMRRQGYFLVGSDQGIFRVTPGGAEMLVAASGNDYFFDVVPSPDGKLLAEVRYERRCDDPVGATAFACAIRLRFLDAATLEEQSPIDTATFMLGTFGNGAGYFPDNVWSPEGDFYMVSGEVSLRKTPSQAAVWAPRRFCVSPATSSSGVSATGTWVSMTSEGKLVITRGYSPFGCL